MIDADKELYDVEYIVIGKSFAKSVGIVSKSEVTSFFTMLAGRYSMDWYIANNDVRLQWCCDWHPIDNINVHTNFRVLPAFVVPFDTVRIRKAQFDAMPSKPIGRWETKGNWFNQHTKQRIEEGEDEVAFEYRIIRTLAAVFRAVKKSNSVKATP